MLVLISGLHEEVTLLAVLIITDVTQIPKTFQWAFLIWGWFGGY
jgi:hypothetical protein